MADFDWQALEMHHYLAFGGGGLVVLALLIYMLKGGKLAMPAIVTCGIGCLIAGIAIGMLALAGFGYHWEPQTRASTGGPIQAPPGAGGAAGAGGGGMMAPGGGGGGRGGPGGGGGARGGQGPNSKRQLAALVDKLDLLTNKPLTIQFNDEQKKQVAEQLKGLKELPELSEDEAKKRFDALLALLEPQKETMQAAGFRWPGAGGGGPMGDIPNPFREDNHTKTLESLQTRLGAGPAKPGGSQ